MFSRTTMASSISSPTHKDKAMSVTILRVKPKAYMNKNVPMMAMGSVSPVMMVERQEFKNKNTISTVRSAPSIKVRRTLSTPTRMGLPPSDTSCNFKPGGSWGVIWLTARFRPSITSSVLASCDFWIESSKVRSPLYSAKFSSSWGPSTTCAICPSKMGVLPRRATIIFAKSSGRSIRASSCTTRSFCRVRKAPKGKS